IQPGGRVALLAMRRPVSALVARTLTVNSVTDPRGQPVVAVAHPVLTDLRSGVAVRGRVARADGSPAIGVPVTLTMFDQDTGFSSVPWTVRPSQVFTDDDGYFEFDYVMAGVPYSVSATDISGLAPDALAAILGSASGDQFDRAKLLDLANSPSVQNSL